MNDPKVVRPPERGGWGCDAAWADDFHHALRVALTGETDGWYEEFADLGTLVKAFHRPHVHDGTYSTLPRPPLRRAAPTTSRPSASSSSPPTTTRSATARSATGCPPRARPLAALLTCLAPFTPMLFQGEEYGERAPFQFFSDHIDAEIADGDARGAAARVRRVRRVRRGDPRPAGPDDVRALQADARRASPPGCATLYAAALALRARAGRRREAAPRPTAAG